MMVNNARVMPNIAIVNVSRIVQSVTSTNGRDTGFLSGVEASPLDEQYPVFGLFGSSPRTGQRGRDFKGPIIHLGQINVFKDYNIL